MQIAQKYYKMYITSDDDGVKTTLRNNTMSATRSMSLLWFEHSAQWRRTELISRLVSCRF